MAKKKEVLEEEKEEIAEVPEEELEEAVSANLKDFKFYNSDELLAIAEDCSYGDPIIKSIKEEVRQRAKVARAKIAAMKGGG